MPLISKQDWDVLRLQRGDITREQFIERNPNSQISIILHGEIQEEKHNASNKGN